MYRKATTVTSLHACLPWHSGELSSLPSPQSSSPSHIHVSGMQRPLLHRNWRREHASATKECSWMSFNKKGHNIWRYNKNSRWTARGSNPGRGKVFSPKLPYQLCGPPSLPLNGYREFFPGYIGHVVKLTTHPHLVSRLRMSRLIPLLLLYAFMAWTGKAYLHITGKQDKFWLIWNRNTKKCFRSVTSGLKCDFLLPGMPNRQRSRAEVNILKHKHYIRASHRSR